MQITLNEDTSIISGIKLDISRLAGEYIFSKEYLMDLERFIDLFAAEFDETERSVFTAETEFKALEEWNSMRVMVIMTMVDNKYEVTLKASD
jgi:acyl carrier protein